MKTAVVVGGGRSLGAFLSKHLATEGFRVAVLDINAENACAVAQEIVSAGGEAKGYYVNACQEDSVTEVFAQVSADLSAVYLMLYVAGIARSAKITEFTLKDFTCSVDVNLTGYFLCARAAARIMIDNGIEGRIIQINSKSGCVGSKYNAGYSASKFGGVGLTQSMALDLAEHGITVNSLMLGNLLYSDMFQSLIPSYAKKLGIPEDQVVQTYIDKVPLKRGCEFQDVANVLDFYASEKASYCTGQSIKITGGQVM